MNKQEKGLIGCFAVFVGANILHMASDIFEMLSDSDPYGRVNRGSSVAQNFIGIIMMGCAFVYVLNRMDDQEDKIDAIQNQNHARFFGGRANRFPPPQIVIDRMQVEGQEDQKEGQRRNGRN